MVSAKRKKEKGKEQNIRAKLWHAQHESTMKTMSKKEHDLIFVFARATFC
jgi:hypothetical protein